MFEGLVRQLLLGYLGRYIKDIHKDQLKITVWNEEVLLENVELILEAFEYLQLPFALKQGRVGRLSIKIPWKKLGREPIIIMLEDVFIGVSQRSDQEWSSDAIERREFAGKKAKLAAAELAKLSRRVCDSPAGNPFMSYIAAKILDSIQVSVRNFHVLYYDTQPESVRVIFGLRFSGLTVTKQNLVGLSVGRVRGGQVNKLVEIEALEIYCGTYEGNVDFLSVGSNGGFDIWCDSRLQSDKVDYLLKPVHVRVTLLVNRSGELDDDQPQYSISVELTDLIMTLNDFQLQQILILLDYLQTSQLRERYGRYRPSSNSLSRKPPGWQKLWWHYAQKSILSDVRKKLRKTSWRFLGQQLTKRRMYISLYKKKLEFLRREQPIDASVLLGLEEVEKESDIDDILRYRSVAEGQMQEAFSDTIGGCGVNTSEKQQTDERSSNRSRGWLNWLSRGMLGAGGTDDSSQFSGVVSDEIIKDIHEATKFHPPSSLRNMGGSNKICTCSIRLNIRKISTVLQSVYGHSFQVVTELDILGVVVDCKFWKGFTAVTASVISGRLFYPQNGKEILSMKGAGSKSGALEKPSYAAQMEVSQDHNIALSLKVTLQPLEATCDVDFFLAVSKFFSGSRSFKLQHERVLSSLNGLDDKTRLTAKAKYLLSSREKVKLDVSIKNITVNLPGQSYNLVFILESLCITGNLDSLNPKPREQSYIVDGFQSSVTSINDLQVKDLYDHFEINLCGFEMRVMKIHPREVIIPVLERSSISINLASCIVPEESSLKQLEVNATLSTIDLHFSPSVCEAVMSVIRYLDVWDPGAHNPAPDVVPIFAFTIDANLALLKLHVNLANHGENSTVLILYLQELDLWYSLTEFEEWSIRMKALKMNACSEDGGDCHDLCSSGNLINSSSSCGPLDVQCSDQTILNNNSTSPEDFISLSYKAYRSVNVVCHKYSINWRNAELHCYPYIFGLLAGFVDKMSFKISSTDKNQASPTSEGNTQKEVPGFGFERFGFSNFIEKNSCGCIPMDRYPFMTIYNDGSLGSLESALCYSVPDWRKIFSLRNKKDRAEDSLDCRFETCDCSLNAFPSSRGLGLTTLFTVDMHLSDANVHFHDSSSVFGTIKIPVSKLMLTISDDHVDLVSSVENLMLKSPLWTNYFDGFLWGHSLPNLSPVLNLRVRKGNLKSSSSELEVSIGVQHSCCVLLPEYLAIIIGYFSLPDWTSMSAPQSITHSTELIDPLSELAITYKFEILDSTLILPVENDDRQLLKVDIRQLYINFVPNCFLSNVVQHIPQECVIPLNQVARSIDCLNIFGRDLSLSSLLSKNGRLPFKQDTECSSVTLASPISADVWIKIPCDRLSSSTSTCIMARVGVCEIMVDDSKALHGFQAFVDVIDQLTLVDEVCKLFTSDVPQFLHAKKHLKQERAIVSNCVEVRCLVNLLRMKLYRARKELEPSEPVIQTDMKFLFTGTFKNNMPISLEIRFFYVELYSLLNSVMLARCTNMSVDSSVPGIRFTQRDDHGYELWFSLPSIDILLHYFDWNETIELLSSCAKKLEHSDQDHFLSESSNSDIKFDSTEVSNDVENTNKVSSMLESWQSENSRQGTSIALKSENIGVRIHFPFCISDTISSGFRATGIQERFEDENVNTYKGQYCKYISVAAFNNSGELFVLGRNVKLSCKFEKIIGTVSMSGVETVDSCSLFGVEQLDVETQIQMDQRKIVNVDMRILSDHVEMHVSHQVLSFCQGVAFDSPEMASSQSKQGSMNVKVQIRDISVLISDGRWGCGGLLLDVLMQNFFLQANLTEKNVESSVSCDLQVKYNNMHKVLWEPFVEPWKFDIKIARKFEINALQSKSGLTEIIVASSAQLNINLTESLFECIFRTIEMVENAWGLVRSKDIPENNELSMPYCIRNSYGERYAPYVFQNLTSLPLVYQVFQAHNFDVLDMSALVVQNSVQPGASVPIYLDDSDNQLFDHGDGRRFGCSRRKLSSGVTHHYMRVQLAGTFVASPPCSMDRIGLSYFEVDFSKTSNDNTNVEEARKTGLGNGFVVPVVFEVSLQRQSKLIRVYSTVIIFNSTSMPLELRFDIPFGVSPKILDPISPGQEFPLPLHLAEAGRLRWRPLGDSYLWSEAHSISKLLSQKSKVGFRRSYACYPCHPSNEPFRCCISVQSISLPASFHYNDLPEGNFGRRLHDVDRFRERFIHQVTLSTPLVVRNCLPEPISLTVESGGITLAALLSEGDAPFHHIDPSHDLVLEFKMHGFRPACLKFSRSETFSTVAKFSGGKFSQTETVSFDSDLSRGSVFVSFEKTVDISCGAREVSVFVPFLLYNCTGTPLIVSNCTNEAKGIPIFVPSCYNLFEQHFVQSRKDGLGILSCEKDFLDIAPNVDAAPSLSSSESGIANLDAERIAHKPVSLSSVDRYSHKLQEFPADKKESATGQKRNMSSKSLREACFLGNEHSKVKACIYSPCPISSASDIMIKVQKGLPGSDNANGPHSLWSAPFSLGPPSGSISVVVPQTLPGEASLLSVTCSILGGAFGGRTQAVTFQPRYVICNSCSKDLCYKQKGTNLVSQLAVGQHSQLHWTDTTRELLVSIRFNEPGWQWSGSFLPDQLGDTQLKMWNYVTGALNMVRVEVQNSYISSGDEKIAGSIRGNVGTNLILLSDDDMGYMPYRIDNFSKERLRVYQQKCETFDTIIHPYTSCPYAWDEPCYPHRLTIEVPGDRVIGSYALDITKQPIPVHLRPTSEKPERTLLLSICAEGATKVLSVVDSGYHATKNVKEKFNSKFQEKGSQKLQKDNVPCYTENFLLVLPSIGISLVNSQPQELIYACVSNLVFDLNQSLDQQKLSFQISSLQIDNPVYNSSYPVILSFNHEQRVIPPDWCIKDTKTKSSSEVVQQKRSKTHDAVLYAGLVKWRKKDSSLASFEHINLRIADFCLELELETVLSLLEFVKAVLPESQSRLLPLSDPTLHPLIYDTGSAKDTSVKDGPPHARNVPVFNKSQRTVVSFPSIVPIGAPWQRIHLLARRHRKIYVETFELAPVKFTLSFSSAPWMRRNGVLTSGESLIHRGLMALADVEGARIHLKQLTIVHHMSSVESFQEILIGHYTRQILHEIYKVFGSAGVIGNPMGFARNVALGIKDFLSAPARSVSKSPTGLIQGMAQGTTSLLSSTVYALSDAATQFSKAAHKGIVAFTFNDHDVARMENQQKGEGSHSKGVIGEVFEGLTGLLESPIRGAEKHGLPGVVSGIALGITGLVARPTASILEVTGKTAQSIRNRSRLHNTRFQRRRLRFPRPLNSGLPLQPYSWEEAIGSAVLTEAGDDLKLKGETLVKCKALKQGGNFVVVTGRLILVVSSPILGDFRKPSFQGVAVDLEWKIEREIDVESVIHVDASGQVVHIVGSSSDSASRWRQNQQKKSSQSGKRWNPPVSSALPLLQTTLELPSEEEAEELLQLLLSTIEAAKNQGWHSRFVLHQSNLR